MQPAGLREIEAAKADGRWDAAYEGAARMDVPGELAAALAGNRKAKAFFDTLDRTNRYAFCWRSEEHTSELQSLMRISYAVFCLKKKTIHIKLNNTQHSY